MSLFLSHPLILLAFIVAGFSTAVWYNVRMRSVDNGPTIASERANITPAYLARNLPALLAARAATNVRLMHVFGFARSAFVTDDSAVHRQFVTCAKTLLAPRWTELRCVARSAVARYAPGSAAPFAEYVQAVTLATILTFSFGTSPQAMAYDDLVRVANDITDLAKCSHGTLASWIQSREADVLVVPRDHPDWTIELDENPLEFVVPSFETLWRVVAVAYALLAINKDNCASAFVPLMKAEQVDKEIFDGVTNTPAGDVRPLSFVTEVLRIYPPTRRITRGYPVREYFARKADLSASRVTFITDPNCCQPTHAVIKADIERAQRSRCDFGPTANEFDPARKVDVRDLLAFGSNPLRCPGQKWAPQAVTIIVAALLESQLLVTTGKNLGDRAGWEGWTLARKLR
ncbi:hypothetical protein BKA62DRAFT_716764 [Auriculariales sp. MPI-PUGE-AT-0066]|nr:hypothetical protein BKA62DRAFT_716764 [Auriculariales sp. MPI-PUGE-AT-0066]